MEKFTPGPWIAVGQNSGNYRIVFSDRGNWLAEVFADGEWPDTVEADARLIAASPDLYALADMIARLNPDAGEIGPGMLAEIIDRAQKALAKARGEA